MRRFIHTIFIIVLVCAWAQMSWARTPQRIVSLKPNITEILFALGVGDHVVAATRWCNVPKEASALPKVGDYIRPNIEAIIALQADLVIGARENSERKPIEMLRARGVAVELYNFNSLTNIAESIEAIGQRVGASARARVLTQAVRTSAEQKTSTTKSAVLVTSWYPLVVAGPSSFLGEVLTSGGGINVITAQQPAYPTLSAERMMALNPACIIDISHQQDGVPQQWLERLRHTDALAHNCVHQFPIEDFRPGPRIADAVTSLRQVLQP